MHLYMPIWTRFTFVMFSVCPGIDEASHAPFEIVFSSSLTHSTEGWGNPFAAHRKRKWSPSRTTTDLGLSVPYSAAFEIRKWLFEWPGKSVFTLLAIDGGINISLENVPFTLTFHRLIPGTPFEPSFPCFPVRPLGPVEPINLKRRKKIESGAYSRSVLRSLLSILRERPDDLDGLQNISTTKKKSIFNLKMLEKWR